MSEHIDVNAETNDTPEGTDWKQKLLTPAEEMIEGIVARSKGSSIHEGLTSDSSEPEEDETDYSSPDVQRELIQKGEKMLADSGFYADLERQAQPSETEIELRVDALDNALDSYDEEKAFERGTDLLHASPQAFLALMDERHREEVDANLEAAGYEELPDDLDPETHQAILDTDTARFAREVLEEATKDALAVQAEGQAVSAQFQSEAETERWASAFEKGFGVEHLPTEKVVDLVAEVAGFQAKVGAEGYDLLEGLIDGYHPATQIGQKVYQLLTVPIGRRSPDDPDFAPACRALRVLGSRFVNASLGRDRQMEIVNAAGPRALPMLDRDREAYIDNMNAKPAKPVITMSELDKLLARDPNPARSGKQVQMDVAAVGSDLRQEMERARRSHEKHYAKETARIRGFSR